MIIALPVWLVLAVLAWLLRRLSEREEPTGEGSLLEPVLSRDEGAAEAERGMHPATGEVAQFADDNAIGRAALEASEPEPVLSQDEPDPYALMDPVLWQDELDPYEPDPWIRIWDAAKADSGVWLTADEVAQLADVELTELIAFLNERARSHDE